MIFYIRIELHGAALSDYPPLHEAMKAAGYTATVLSDSNTTYHLPSAMYRCQGKYDLEAITKQVRKIADNTGFENDVIAIPTQGAQFHLRPVKTT